MLHIHNVNINQKYPDMVWSRPPDLWPFGPKIGAPVSLLLTRGERSQEFWKSLFTTNGRKNKQQTKMIIKKLHEKSTSVNSNTVLT